MSNTNTGGPAFPSEYFDPQLQRLRAVNGMTLRDYFAAKCLENLVPRRGPFDAAEEAYQYADAMLKAREA